VSVEKLPAPKFAKIELRQDALGSIFSDRLDIFYPPKLGCLGRKESFSTDTPVLDSHQPGRYLWRMTEPYRVFVVLDREYGQRLAELAQTGPVWIVDTPANRPAAKQIWAANPNRSHLDGITTFKFEEGSSSEDILIDQLDTIDLHHGTYSANPPYTILDVIGTAITAKLKTELSEFGFDEFQETPQGFRAVRPLPSDDVHS